MNWRRRTSNSPPGTGGVARRAGVVVKSKWFSVIPMNEWGGELFDPSTTPSLRATPPVPGGELLLPLLQFIHIFCDRAYKGACFLFYLLSSCSSVRVQASVFLQRMASFSANSLCSRSS